MRKFETASDRLALLLPWLNDESLSTETTLLALHTFKESFDGSVGAGYVDIYRGQTEPWVPDFIAKSSPPLHARRRARDPDYAFQTREQEIKHDLWELREYLLDLLRKGFWPASGPVGPWVAELPSLRFGVRGAHRSRPGKLSRTSNAERRAYSAPGAYVLFVDGSLNDLVVFLVAHLLTAQGMATLSRCPAPAPHSTGRCGRFLLMSGQGRPRIFCSEACRQRSHAERLEEQIRRERPRAKTRKRRK